MNYKEVFEDEGFVYELTVQNSETEQENLHTFSQGEGYCARWVITEKRASLTREIGVTDDDCDLIVFSTLDAAVRGSKEFLQIR